MQSHWKISISFLFPFTITRKLLLHQLARTKINVPRALAVICKPAHDTVSDIRLCETMDTLADIWTFFVINPSFHLSHECVRSPSNPLSKITDLHFFIRHLWARSIGPIWYHNLKFACKIRQSRQSNWYARIPGSRLYTCWNSQLTCSWTKSDKNVWILQSRRELFKSSTQL